MQPRPPFWFQMRQGKVEPAGENIYRLSAPNLAEAFLSVRSTSGSRWRPVLRLSQDGPDLADTALELDTEQDAWEAAFELYRTRMVV